MRAPQIRLCFLLSRSLCRNHDPLALTETVIRAGVDAIQVREKEMTSGELVEWAGQVQEVCQRAGALLIVNDNVEVAAALKADGLHLGQDDMHPEDARKIVGPDCLLGLSTHDLEQVDEAVEFGVQYAGFGPVFATQTKGYSRGLGPEYLAAAMAIARLPLMAIGGITPENVWMIPPQVGVAASSAICQANDPVQAVRQILFRGAVAP
ncbi:MAG: thiamine phosphate synthase [Planctomycetota bacterium]|nr:MAG: thiamine phosphate synthase [Planctomycetota bacterium]